jgi:HAD superfamily hydrolase (TIGR01509 family)
VSRIIALLFDLDGTLAETDTLHFPVWAEILADHGVHADWDFYQERVSGRLNPDIIAEFMPHLSEVETHRLLDYKESEFRRRAPELSPLPGLMELLERARHSEMELALVTNAPAENARALTGAIGLSGIFAVEVFAGELPAGKPDPLAYSTALKRLEASAEESLAFEDSPSGIASAVGAGITTVGIASTHTPDKLRAAGASYVYPDFDNPELLALISG